MGELLERDGQLAAIDAARARAAAGDGSFVLIEGPAGIGKTRLAEHALAGDGVLAARGAEIETGFPFGVVRQLFEPPLRRLDAPVRAEVLAGAAALATPIVAPRPTPTSPCCTASTG